MSNQQQTRLTGFETDNNADTTSDRDSTLTEQSRNSGETNADCAIDEMREQAIINPDAYEQQDMTHCLSFTVSAKWGHFRRVDGNAVASTYGIPPRTTITGLISAILGFQRNSYYDVFDSEHSRIAIQPVTERRTMAVPETVLNTDNDNIKSINSRGKLTLSMPKPNAERQRKNFEVLVDPAYRVDVSLSTTPIYTELQEFLNAGKAYYTPRMGKSEYLADITYHGENELTETTTDTGNVAVDSVVPVTATQTIPDAESRYRTEKTPTYMTHTESAGNPGRRTTEFTHITYNPDTGPVTVTNVQTYTVDGRTVAFI